MPRPLTPPPCHAQALLATKKASLEAAAAVAPSSSADSDGAGGVAKSLVWPFSASCSRTTIAAVHAAHGQGLSLVRRGVTLLEAAVSARQADRCC
jgi:hypothetical protein